MRGHSGWPAQCGDTGRPRPECGPWENPCESVLGEETAEALDLVVDAREPQRVPERGEVAGDHGFSAFGLDLRDLVHARDIGAAHEDGLRPVVVQMPREAMERLWGHTADAAPLLLVFAEFQSVHRHDLKSRLLKKFDLRLVDEADIASS